MRQLLKIILLSVLMPISAQATHIIGGYMSYQHISGQQFQIELIVYRDCYGGAVPFDLPARVAQYDYLGNLIATHNINVSDSVTVITSNACTVSNLCIRRARYLLNINLDPQFVQHTFVYQRCCRSLPIVNLVDPGDAGITISCTIDPVIFNNSPVYDHEYASFTYTGDYFRFYASATDPDGDSLVYSLDNVIAGASQIDPVPLVPAPPPYAAIPWSPGYSQSNMLTGSVPLTIDPNSGLMSATPGWSGHHVIACKVDEFRNGTLIGSYRREFVVIVGIPTLVNIPVTVQVQGGGTPLDDGDAWLIRLNLLDSTLFAVDTAVVTGGSFLHNDQINGLYLSKVSARPSSNYYADHIPTYYGDVLFWDQATQLNFCSPGGVFPDINMVQGVNPGGPGFIGGFISEGANKYAQSATTSGATDGITVILFNSLSEPVAYGITDAFGNFGIGNLPIDNYRVYIDRLGYHVDNTIAPVLSVTNQQPVVDAQQFILHNTWLEHLGTVGFDDEALLAIPQISIYPNPVANKLILNFDSDKFQNVNYTILNATGAEIKRGKLNEKSIDVSNLSPQVYFVKFYFDETIQVVKFFKY